MAGRMQSDPVIESIEDVFRRVGQQGSRPLIEALIEREQQIADLLRANAERWGLHAPIVAEALAATQMGRPMTDAERLYIHQSFHRHIESLPRDE